MKYNMLLFLILLITSILMIEDCEAKSIRVMVIDTGIDLSHNEIKKHIPLYELDKSDYIDVNSHGTHVSGIIVKNVCDQVELYSCRYYYPFTKIDSSKLVIQCFQKAIKMNLDFINFSGGGRKPILEEWEAIKALSDNRVLIIVAAGNDGKDLSIKGNNYYPAKYKGITNLIPVGNLTPDLLINESSNYGLEHMEWEIGTNIESTVLNGLYGTMSGTSQATAVHTNRLIKEKCREINK